MARSNSSRHASNAYRHLDLNVLAYKQKQADDLTKQARDAYGSEDAQGLHAKAAKVYEEARVLAVRLHGVNSPEAKQLEIRQRQQSGMSRELRQSNEAWLRENAPEALKPPAKAAGLKAFAEQGAEQGVGPGKPKGFSPPTGEASARAEAQSQKAFDLSEKARKSGSEADHKAAMVAHAVAAGEHSLSATGAAASALHEKEAQGHADEAAKIAEQREKKTKAQFVEAGKTFAATRAAGGGEEAAKGTAKVEEAPKPEEAPRTGGAAVKEAMAATERAMTSNKAEDHAAAAKLHEEANLRLRGEGKHDDADWHEKAAQRHSKMAKEPAAEAAPKPAVAEAKPKGSVNAGLVAWRERRAALATAGKDAESTGKAAMAKSKEAKDAAGHTEAARHHEAAHALHNAAREAAEKAGDQKKALHHAEKAMTHRMAGEQHRASAGGMKTADAKASKLAAFAKEKQKQLGMVQRGKKGGLFVVTKGGHKSYVGKK